MSLTASTKNKQAAEKSSVAPTVSKQKTVSKHLFRVAGGSRWGGVEYAPLLQEETPETEAMETQQGAGGLTGGYGCMHFDW